MGRQAVRAMAAPHEGGHRVVRERPLFSGTIPLLVVELQKKSRIGEAGQSCDVEC